MQKVTRKVSRNHAKDIPQKIKITDWNLKATQKVSETINLSTRQVSVREAENHINQLFDQITKN